MPVYWSMMAVTLAMGLLSYGTSKIETMQGGKVAYKTRIGYSIIPFLYIIFFAGFRDQIIDTYWYKSTFEIIPTSFSGIVEYAFNSPTKVVYFLTMGIFKKFLSQNYYVWFFFLASISCAFIFRTLYKYSVDLPLTVYLFLANGMFFWLFNGARQFLAAAILFAFYDWLIEGKKIQYMVLVMFVAFIHSSALFVIPVCWFISSKKVLGRRMMFFAGFTVIGTFFSKIVFYLLRHVGIFEKYYVMLSNGEGSGAPRFIVACVPVLIAVLSYRRVKEIAPPSIILAINMSFVGCCFYFASMFTNGILVGRMALYFTLSDLYLLPWLIRNGFTKESRKIVWWGCLLFYLIFFYYQMQVVYEGLYISEFLHLHF